LIKIRYADLPAGLHVRAERSGRSTVIYLLPGLSHTERRAALLRARSSASMGHGPRLPAAGVAAAVARDRAGATARNGAAAFRAHPLLLLPPVLIVASATLAYVMLSTVSITFPQSVPGGPARSAPAGPPPRAGAGTSSPAGASAPLNRPEPGSSRTPRGSRPPPPGSSGSASPEPLPSSEPPAPSPVPSPAPSSCLNLGLIGVCLK
jgi:hypothetical protein